MTQSRAKFGDIPFQEAVDGLREMGELMLRGILEGAVPGPDSMTGVSLPMSRRGLPGRRLGIVRQWLRGRKLRRLVRGGMNAKVWRRSFHRQLEADLGGMDGVPDEFWWLAGKAAWHDLEFQRVQARLVRQNLSRRFLLTEDLPPVLFSPRTFWFCLAWLAECGTLEKGLRGRDSRRLVTLLKRQSSRFSRVEHWAGFWDQWLIGEMLPALPARHLPPEKQRFLAALPYLEIRGINNPQPLARSKTARFFMNLARWRMVTWDRVVTLFLRRDTADPSAKNWKAQVPPELRGQLLYPGK